MRIITSSKQNILVEELFRRIGEDLDAGEEVVLVVPAQASLSMEQKAFDFLKKDGFFRLRIIRGQKLHEEILRDGGRPSQTPVNTIGRSMLLRKIIKDHRSEFSVFSHVGDDSGFTDMAGDFIVQLKQNNIDSEKLRGLASESGAGSLMGQKLSDMSLIFDAYQAALSGKFTDSEDMLAYVSGKIGGSSFVKKSKFYYYGFYSFTVRETEFLSELDRCGRGLCIALLRSVGAPYTVSEKTILRLKNRISSVSVEELDEGEYAIPALKKVVVSCANPFVQAETIASDIRRLIRTGSCRYSDIAVLCGGDDAMISTIKRVFSLYSIPVFADEKRSVLHSSAIEAVSSLLDMVSGDFKTSDIIRFLKSGVLGISSENTASFENYAKLYHIKGDRLHQEFRYGKKEYDSFEFDAIERVRKRISSLCLDFAEKFDSATTVSEKSACLYAFLSDSIHLDAFLENRSQQQAEDGFVDAAEAGTQLWDCIVSVLEQMVELLGDEAVSDAEYSDMLISALADLKVGVLPQAEGKIQLGTVSRSHLEGIKALYVAGFNDGIIPSDNDASGILTEEESAALSKKGFVLSKNTDTLAEEEQYNLYANLACAEDYLCLTYCGSDADGNDLKPSPELLSLKKKYGPFEEREDIVSENNELAFLEGSDFASGKITADLRAALSGEKLSELTKFSYNVLKDSMRFSAEALKYKNSEAPVSKASARELFARDGEFSFSPSRLDGFAACPFRHFIHYGLNPEEKKEFTIDGSDIGSIYHELLMRLCNEVTDWQNTDDAQIEALADRILTEITAGEAGELINSSKSQQYISKRMRKVCIRFARYMAEQLRHEVIEKMFVEVSFGRGKTIPPIEITCSAGKVYVEGKIDRVDICPDGDGHYVRVVDYKSGSDTYDRSLIEKGLKLQLMTYLEGVMSGYPDDSRTGVYYFSIKDPQVAAGLQDLPASALSEELLKKIKKQYKLDGEDVDAAFRAQFASMLASVCERLSMGEIAPQPKVIGTKYDTCRYCDYAGICLKDLNPTKS